MIKTDKFVINGVDSLNGSIKISGSKNAALPIIAASLLACGECRLKNIPSLTDISLMCDILKCFGVSARTDGGVLIIDSSKIINNIAPYELTGKIRGSFLVMGAMLSRCGRVRISLPGGCRIGARPVDLHLKGFSALGAKISQGHGYIDVKAKELSGNRIYLDFPSVGATENIMMAAVSAKGQTVIENASQEPEIVDLANFLCAMGAKIYGAGTDYIRIDGAAVIKPCDYCIIPDRIEAGSFMAATAAVGGSVHLDGIVPSHLGAVAAKLSELGAKLDFTENSLDIVMSSRPGATDIKTLPFPGFPTDMQSQMSSVLSVADGTSIITETIFENRFMHAAELTRMGACVKIEGQTCIIEGKKRLTGSKVRASDLRAGAALTIAALAAKGKSEIYDIHHIERGYDRFEEKLSALGADIRRVGE